MSLDLCSQRGEEEERAGEWVGTARIHTGEKHVRHPTTTDYGGRAPHPTAVVCGGSHLSTSAWQTTPSMLTQTLPPTPMAIACYNLQPDQVAVGKGPDPKKITNGVRSC